MADVVVPGVWWLHETRGGNVYLVEAADGQLLLVDTGFEDSVDGIARELARVAGGRPLSCILLTHAHMDHAGAAGILRGRTGAKVVAGRGDCTTGGDRTLLAETVGRSHIARRLAGLIFRHPPHPVVEVDQALEGEVEVAPGILAIPSPGHTHGSYWYLDRDKGVAFVGDLVICHTDGLARPMQMSNVDDDLYLASLAGLGERAPGVGCAGHGAPVLDDFAGQVRGLSALPRGPRLPFSPARAKRLARFGRQMSSRREHPGG